MTSARLLRLTIGMAAATLLVGCSTPQGSEVESSPATAVPTSRTPTESVATSAPTSTSTPSTSGASISEAVLGGSRAAWDDRFEQSLPGVEGSPTYSPCDGNLETFQYGVSFAPAAYFISFGACDEIGPADLPDAENQARSFFPADARQISDFTTDVGEEARVYASPSLGQVVSANKDLGTFSRDCNGDPVEAGTFFLVAEETGWTIGLGTCP